VIQQNKKTIIKPCSRRSTVHG